MAKFLQINLHHCIVATTNLLLHLNRHKIDVALIQEPWVKGDRIMGLEDKSFNLIHIGNINKPRTCILARKNIKCFILRQFCCRDVITMKMDMGNFSLMVVSAYFPHFDIIEPPPQMIRDLVGHCRELRTDLLVGCDANSHHLLWGSTDTNDRGLSLLDFLIENNLSVYNIGGDPTFQVKNRKEVLDLTFGTIDKVTDWKVSKEVSFSDHKYIEFSVNTGEYFDAKEFRNPRRTNWKKYRELLTKSIKGRRVDTTSIETLETSIDIIEQSLITSFRKACPLSKQVGKKHQPWWNQDLKRLRKISRIAFNKASKDDDDELWVDYRNKLRNYKREIRKAKKENYENLVEELVSIKDTSRLRKLLSKQEHSIGNLRSSDGSWTENPRDTLRLLFQTHFPGCDLGQDRPEIATSSNVASYPRAREIISLETVKWAANTFGPFKSPGIDGIYPKMLQEALDIVGEDLVDIYRFCLEFSYVPASWRNVKVVFIPKAGKIQHCTAKDYRPISLSSFMLKTLERLIDEFIRSRLCDDSISDSQHAYMKGKSVDSALHAVVHHIEKSLSFNDLTLAAFLDIEGAFNNVNSAAIRSALIEMGIDDPVVNWLMTMLNHRYISSELSGFTIHALATRGTPQGGVISPLLWLLVVNGILRTLNASGIKVVAYADDVIIMATGKFIDTVSDVLGNSLKMLSSWAKECGLNVNAAKTEIVLFAGKKNIPKFNLPKLGGTSLKLSASAKFLGVILDSKLNWIENLKERVRKAYAALYSCQKLVGKKWGLKPKLFHWLYTAVVRPVVSYGCHVWWPVTDIKKYSDMITRLNRVALLSLTGAMRTTSTAAMEIVMDILPLDLHIRQNAKMTLTRLHQTKCLRTGQVRHMTQMVDVSGIVTTDYDIPYNITGGSLNIVIPSLDDWVNDRVDYYTLNVFTDGSKTLTGTGSAFHCAELNIKGYYRLDDDCSIFQAEVYAIAKAAETISMLPIYRCDISFFIDSQAALMALRADNIRSKVVSRCHKELKVLSEQHNIRLCWVPGHKDILGNELADELAKKGSELPREVATSDVFPPLSLQFQRIRMDSRTTWLIRWTSSNSSIQTKSLWDENLLKYSKILLDMDRRQLRMVINLTTGHNTLGKHMVRIGIRNDDTCRWCREAVEDSYHFLCECPALSFRRLKYFGSYFFQDLLELRGCNPWTLLGFIKSSKWEA